MSLNSLCVRYKAALLLFSAFLALFFTGFFVNALNSHSVELNGGSQWFSVADSQQSGLDLTDTLTIEMWVKLDSLTQNSLSPLFVKRDGANNQRSYSFYILNQAGGKRLAFDYMNPGDIGSDQSVSWNPSLATWNHVAITKQGTTLRFYVNGIQQGADQTGSFSQIFNSSTPVEIGSWTNEGSQVGFLDGKLDDIRVWNVARSQAQIATDMNKELAGNESGLVAYWKFNGSSLEDVTANNNDLTNNGGATFSNDVPFTDVVTPALTFEASPSAITQGSSSTLSWNAQNATSCTASGAWNGSKSVSGTLAVSPPSTATYSLDCTGDGGSVQKDATVTVTSAPAPASSQAKRKTVSESVTKSAVLQDDDELKFQLVAGKTYIVEGVLFASAGKNVPDLRIAFTAPNGSDMAIGYLTDAVLQNGGGVLTQSNTSSRRIQAPASSSIPVVIKGTIVAGSGGELKLRWAQFTSNTNPMTITKGSYLAIQEI